MLLWMASGAAMAIEKNSDQDQMKFTVHRSMTFSSEDPKLTLDLFLPETFRGG